MHKLCCRLFSNDICISLFITNPAFYGKSESDRTKHPYIKTKYQKLMLEFYLGRGCGFDNTCLYLMMQVVETPANHRETSYRGRMHFTSKQWW